MLGLHSQHWGQTLRPAFDKELVAIMFLMTRTRMNEEWLRDLGGKGDDQEHAISDLQNILLRIVHRMF